MSRQQCGAVVIGGYANGVGVVRSLAAHGVPVDVVLTMPQDVAHFSRHVDEHHWLLDLAERPDLLVELLEANADRWAGRVILPTNDWALETLAAHHDRLSRQFVLPVPPLDLVRRVLDKRETHRIAAEIGLPTPRSYGPATAATVRSAGLEYPVLVKPRHGHRFQERFGRKLTVARTPAELGTAVELVQEAGLECEIVDLVPGSDDRIHHYQVYIDRRGEPVGGFALRKLRQGPPLFGVARACVVTDDPGLREPTIELLRRIGWSGMASVAYKHDDRSDCFRLIEVNGRCPLSHGLARRAGINYPLLAWSEAAEGRPRGADPNGWRGAWIHLHADVLYTLTCLGRERLKLKSMLRSYIGPRTFAVLDRHDPRPFRAQWSYTVRKAVRSVRHRSFRRDFGGRVQECDGDRGTSRAGQTGAAP